MISREEDIMTTSDKDEQEDEHDIDTRNTNHQSPVSKEEQPIIDPVNVDTPGWKSSQGDQGSGVFGTGREKPLDDGQKAEEEAPTEENVSGTSTGVGGEVAPVGGQIPGPGQVRVRGASKEDQERYDKLLAYIENKREEKKLKEDEDKQRMEKMKQKEQRWSLMREAVKFLRE